MRIRQLVKTIYPAIKTLGLFKPTLPVTVANDSQALPHLIFGDTKSELDTLTALAAEFKVRGYKQVMLPGESAGWDECVQHLASEQRIYEPLPDQFTAKGLDIGNNIHVDSFMHDYAEAQTNKIEADYWAGGFNGITRGYKHGEVTRKISAMTSAIQARADTEALQKFVNTYSPDFTCRNIDLADDIYAGTSDAEQLQTAMRRSNAMVDSIHAIDAAAQPAIILVKQAHQPYLRKVIAERYGEHAAQTKFNFMTGANKEMLQPSVNESMNIVQRKN